jgi:hypothetical protein
MYSVAGNTHSLFFLEGEALGTSLLLCSIKIFRQGISSYISLLRYRKCYLIMYWKLSTCLTKYVAEIQLPGNAIMLSRNLKSRYGARNRFQEPSLEVSSQAA